MTRTHPHIPQMPLDDFEDLARGAPETVWLEFVRGRVEVKPPSDDDHSEILVSLLRQFASEDRLWDLYPYAGLCTETSLAGRYLPDAMLVRRGHRLGRGHWASPDIVSAVVEIVHRASGKDHRDHDAKLAGYASAAFPPTSSSTATTTPSRLPASSTTVATSWSPRPPGEQPSDSPPRWTSR